MKSKIFEMPLKCFRYFTRKIDMIPFLKRLFEKDSFACHHNLFFRSFFNICMRLSTRHSLRFLKMKSFFQVAFPMGLLKVLRTHSKDSYFLDLLVDFRSLNPTNIYLYKVNKRNTRKGVKYVQS